MQYPDFIHIQANESAVQVNKKLDKQNIFKWKIKY